MVFSDYMNKTRTASTRNCYLHRYSLAGSWRRFPKHDVYLSMVQAYNTWLAEDYCIPAPDRLIANALIPVSGTDDAVSELGSRT